MAATTMLHVLMPEEMRDAFREACDEAGRMQERVVDEYLEALLAGLEARRHVEWNANAVKSGPAQMNGRIPKALAKRAAKWAKHFGVSRAVLVRHVVIAATEAGAARIERAA